MANYLGGCPWLFQSSCVVCSRRNESNIDRQQAHCCKERRESDDADNGDEGVSIRTMLVCIDLYRRI